MAKEFENFLDERKSDYDFHLEELNFDGPIELLLELTKQHKMDIDTIPLALLTDEFLAYVAKLDKLDLDKTYSFVSVAVELTHIKSRQLLPPVEMPFDDYPGFGGEESPEDNIRRRMQELKVIQDEVPKLKERETIYRLYIEPQYTEKDALITIGGFSLEKIVEAFAKIRLRNSTKATEVTEKKIERQKYLVSDKIKLIAHELKEKNSVRFSELCKNIESVAEMICVYLAILQMLKLEMASVSQHSEDGVYDSDFTVNYVENNVDLSMVVDEYEHKEKDED